MCDFIVISSNSPEDLSKIQHDTVCFSKDIDFEPPLSLLKYDNQYRLFEKNAPCGCFFRVLDPNIGMIEPQEWLTEDEDSLNNTKFVYDTIKRLLADSYQVDCISIWTNQQPDDKVHSYGEINLNTISRNEFAFLFQSYFEYCLE